MSDNAKNIFEKREAHSRSKLTALRSQLSKLRELKDFPTLTIFGAGSYARHEASEYSDIDLFFILGGKKEDVADIRTNSHRLFGRIIDIVDGMGFPKLSNDCEYLKLLPTSDIVSNLGAPIDDHENYFTARMLLLLESQCLYGDEAYKTICSEIVNSYFKDFPDHQETFQPTFLLNDICRFWKTLLLNYESKRNVPPGREGIEARRLKQKVRNFKLKYSRMTTCYASIAALGSHLAPVNESQVLELILQTPRERLLSVAERVPETRPMVEAVLEGYAWFLEKTGLPTDKLEAQFSDKEKRIEMFNQAKKFGDTMFELLREIDRTDSRRRLLRVLVI